MKSVGAKHQQGMALLALLAAILLAASWMLVSRLNAESAVMTAVNRTRNAEVLIRARQALIGYVALQAVQSGEKDPGRLPCPEAPGNFGSSTNEGIAAGNCTLPAVGRLPWRTLGLDKLVDAAGEPLWYVVSPGWALLPPGTPATLTINSNTAGQLTVDSVNNDSVTLIIAPGPAFTVAAAGACSAWTQNRPSSGTPDIRNYLECENAAGATFVTTGPSDSFNDQVIRITVADVMPAIEAAIANRIEREIAPQIKSMYAANWGLSGINPLFPYPAPFPSGAINPDISDYQGTSTATAGLLPVTSISCTGDPRCSTTFVAWNQTVTPTIVQTSGAGSLVSGQTNCSFLSATQARCTGKYHNGDVTVSMTTRASNVAMALRQLDATKVTSEYQPSVWVSVTPSASGSFSGIDGSANIAATATFPSGSGAQDFRVTMDITMIADHPVIDSTNGTYGWFVRNQWHRLLYYKPAVGAATGHTAGFLPTPSCTDSGVNPTCITVANVTPAGKQRAILILAGRSINGSSRPSTVLADYLEFGNATAAFERQSVNGNTALAVNKRINDRIVVIDSN